MLIVFQKYKLYFRKRNLYFRSFIVYTDELTTVLHTGERMLHLSDFYLSISCCFINTKMNCQDKCSICQLSMLRKPVVRLMPCRHLLHESCSIGLFESEEPNCRNCRAPLVESELVERKSYSKNDDKIDGLS